MDTAIFGGGCFWCTEATFGMLRGVVSVTPGYAGGTDPDPSYERVCGGTTGHAEVVRVEYDPTMISYDDLLTVFFATHDPTTRNRQGNDVGTQYRSVILTTTPEQRERAIAFIARLERDGGNPIVTEVRPLEVFYPAEAYHRRYFEQHPEQAYCQLVISPKLEKLKTRFQELLAK
ncbi:peptide-methionine (S)-S-oxide reductase MsrA [Candidatus Uhrbacteria bacterium]|nr:peptide-methionine (S)-S-oxide reductase MsrA [Candidatus Uhrbacteria bacterium]